MNISILCSSKEHPVYPFMEQWQFSHQDRHKVELVQSKEQLSGGDILFLISCADLILQPVRDKYSHTLVIHASPLPIGRGWSPHIWQILEGKKEITVSLLEAEDKVDSGAIWVQRVMKLEGHELYNEINNNLFAIECEIMDFAVNCLPDISPRSQASGRPTYYRRRTPEDSRISPCKSIAEQFDLLRVSDPHRFPAFFDYRGCRYSIRLEKIGKTDSYENE
jgi:methionyl-tRNA formyltransferase